MKTIERYVFGSFLSSFVLAFLVVSFVLTIGLLVQIVGYVMDGVPMSLVGEFCAVSLPETLQWSMPIALLVSSVLVFSRLSTDSEIAAMRACGINILSVMKGPLALGLLCTLLGFWVNNEIVPRGHEVRRNLKTKVSVDTGLSVLEPGRIIDDFPNVKLYFSRKDGNWIQDLVVYDFSDMDNKRMIKADKAVVEQQGVDINLELYNVTAYPMESTEKGREMSARRFVYTMKNVIRQSTYSKRKKDLRFFEMRRRIAELDAAAAENVGKTAAAGILHEQLLCGKRASRRVEQAFCVCHGFAVFCPSRHPVGHSFAAQGVVDRSRDFAWRGAVLLRGGDPDAFLRGDVFPASGDRALVACLCLPRALRLDGSPASLKNLELKKQ